MDILEQMRAGVAYRFTVRLRKFEMKLRPLTVQELIQVSTETMNELQNKPELGRVAVSESTLFAIKTLELASTSAPGKTDYALPAYTLQQLSADELMFLYKEWLANNDRVNPSLEKLSREKLDELVQLAKKNPFALIELSFWEATNLCHHLLKP